MQLGPISPNTCPECHGVLVKIQQGSMIRYRCHTGHSFSLQTLLADVNEEIDHTLWRAIRAIEERILLLNDMAENFGKSEKTLKNRALKQAKHAEKEVRIIREILLEAEALGHTPTTQ
jgi:two-component system, chemotaxis family, protein-glutamate methylesterase/glutaminase